ncbi:MAG: hypothetical protein ACTSQE_10270 [Candidatus Heimdallarchaeaceae archaeon]
MLAPKPNTIKKSHAIIDILQYSIPFFMVLAGTALVASERGNWFEYALFSVFGLLLLFAIVSSLI